VKNAADARANFGLLSEDWLNNALAGNDPMVDPDTARTLKRINDSPPTGAGSDQVKAIESEYKLKPRTLRNIDEARAKLRHLQQQLGRPNTDITKFANELQSDQTAMENQAISRDANEIQRENRVIGNMQNEYTAWSQTLVGPMKQFFGNQDAQNKAKIKSIFRTEGPEAAQKFLESKVKQREQEVKKIPDKNRRVMDAVQ